MDVVFETFMLLDFVFSIIHQLVFDVYEYWQRLKKKKSQIYKFNENSFKIINFFVIESHIQFHFWKTLNT